MLADERQGTPFRQEGDTESSKTIEDQHVVRVFYRHRLFHATEYGSLNNFTMVQSLL